SSGEAPDPRSSLVSIVVNPTKLEEVSTPLEGTDDEFDEQFRRDLLDQADSKPGESKTDTIKLKLVKGKPVFSPEVYPILPPPETVMRGDYALTQANKIHIANIENWICQET